MNQENKIQQFINGQGHKIPFTVPDHYFDDFPAKVQEMVIPKPTTLKTGPLLLKPAFIGVYSVMVLFMIVTAAYYFGSLVKNDYHLTPETLAQYTQESARDFSEDMLVDVLYQDEESTPGEDDDIDNRITEYDLMQMLENK